VLAGFTDEVAMSIEKHSPGELNFFPPAQHGKSPEFLITTMDSL